MNRLLNCILVMKFLNVIDKISKFLNSNSTFHIDKYNLNKKLVLRLFIKVMVRHF